MTHVSSPDDRQLLTIKQLVDSERYREALQGIRKLREKKLDKGSHLRIGVLESRCLTGLGECNKAFNVAEAVVDEGENLLEYRATVIDALLEVAVTADRLFQIDTVIEACDQAERFRREIPTDDEDSLESIRATILHHKSLGIYRRFGSKEAIECAVESLSIRERLRDTSDIASSCLRLAFLYLFVDLGKSLEYVEKALELNEKLDRQGYRIEALILKARINGMKGNLNKGKQGLEQAIDLAREHDLGYYLVPALRHLATVYFSLGDSQRSEVIYNECLALGESAGAALFVATCYNNLGELYRYRGELDKALKGYERSMEVHRSRGSTNGVLTALLNRGLIHYEIGDLDESMRVFEECLDISREQVKIDTGGQYYSTWYLVRVLVEKGMVERAERLVEELHQTMEKAPRKSLSHLMDQLYRLSAATVLKSSTSAPDRSLAKEHLTAVINSPQTTYEIPTMANLLLCDLLVEDIRLHDDEGLLYELRLHLSRFAEKALQRHQTGLHVEVLLLQSKAALVEIDVKQAYRFLDLARKLADEKGLDRMLKRITDERNALIRELTIWEQLGEDKPTMAERTEKVRIHEQIEKMMREGSWRRMLF